MTDSAENWEIWERRKQSLLVPESSFRVEWELQGHLCGRCRIPTSPFLPQHPSFSSISESMRHLNCSILGSYITLWIIVPFKLDASADRPPPEYVEYFEAHMNHFFPVRHYYSWNTRAPNSIALDRNGCQFSCWRLENVYHQNLSLRSRIEISAERRHCLCSWWWRASLHN